jgi:predicted PurR-regulated permease PerM
MPQNRKYLTIIFWLVFAILFSLFVYLLYILWPFYGALFSLIGKLLIPFILSGIIAYLLFPVIKKLDQLKIHRGLAILIIYVLFFGGLGYLFYLVYPAMIHQLKDLSENLPQLITMYNQFISDIYESTSFLPHSAHHQVEEFVRSIEKTLEDTIAKLVGGFTHLFDFIIIISVIPVLVFYFIKDQKQFKAFFMQWVPRKHHKKVIKLFHALDDSLGGYIRGQLIVSVFVAFTTYIIFNILNLEYALLLSIIMGITNIIPYFGPIIGAIPAVTIAAADSGQLVLFVIIGVLIIQIIEGNLLSPYIVGKSIKMHPALIIFVLLLGSELFGFIGLIIAVPFFAFVKAIIQQLRIFRINN